MADAVLALADEKDTGVHERLVCSFDAHESEWRVVVNCERRIAPTPHCCFTAVAWSNAFKKPHRDS
jgi:hypothetical protein